MELRYLIPSIPKFFLNLKRKRVLLRKDNGAEERLGYSSAIAKLIFFPGWMDGMD